MVKDTATANSYGIMAKFFKEIGKTVLKTDMDSGKAIIIKIPIKEIGSIIDRMVKESINIRLALTKESLKIS